MTRVALVCGALTILASLLAAQEVKLPGFFLRYTGGFNHEEDEEEADLRPDSVRHSVRLRIKEEWSSRLTSNLTFYYSTKEYLEEELDHDYWYVYLKPEVSFDATDRLRLDGGFRSKWAQFEGPDAGGLSKDYLSLSGNVGSTVKAGAGTRIVTSVKGTWDVHEADAKSSQSVSAGLRLTSRRDQITVGGNYKAGLSGPLGENSDEEQHLSNEFGVSLTWDPNR